ncbi:hypothetical protein NW754_001355 [Fusarium falciforme]|nr:hypothetical protein NW754_001355 [Fusarium falciforme]
MGQSKDYVNHGGLSRTAIFNAVDASLERLQTDTSTCFRSIDSTPRSPLRKPWKALHDLVQCGSVRYIGASSMWAYWICPDAVYGPEPQLDQVCEHAEPLLTLLPGGGAGDEQVPVADRGLG